MDRIKHNKPQIDQLRNLEGRLSVLFIQLKDFIMSLLEETDLDPETVINQIRDLRHRVRDINELVTNLDAVYPQEGLREGKKLHFF